ncbi:hypothetical protein H9P43_009991 [Blastocladiella emersonii ATCC 22665]|nr:hypothetical protein H9P43_009991 [Blastocladiella emersonii ATCC 22665]
MSMSMTASTHDAALLHSGWDASASVALGSIASHLFAPTGPTTPAEEIASGQFEAAQLHLALQAAGMHGDQRHDHGHGLDHDHDASAAAMVDFDALASHYAATTAAVLGDHSVAASPSVDLVHHGQYMLLSESTIVHGLAAPVPTLLHGTVDSSCNGEHQPLATGFPDAPDDFAAAIAIADASGAASVPVLASADTPGAPASPGSRSGSDSPPAGLAGPAVALDVNAQWDALLGDIAAAPPASPSSANWILAAAAAGITPTPLSLVTSATSAPGSTVGSIVSSPVAGTLESFVAANSSGLPAPPSPPSTSWYPPPGSSIDLAGITTDHSLPVVVSQPSTIMPDLNAVVPIHDYASSSALPYIPEFAQPHHHQFPAYHFPHLAYPPSPESPLPPLLFGASAAAAESHDTSMLDAFVATASSMPQSAPAILEGPIQSYFPSILADTAPLAVSPSVIMHRRSHSLSCLTSASEAAAAATAAALHHELASTSPTVFGFSAPNSPVVLSQPDLDASLADALQPPRKRPRSKSESVALASGTGSGHLGHLQHLFHHPHAHSLQHMYSQPPLESPVPVGLSASSRSNLRPLLPAPTATASSASDAPATTSAAPASTSTPAGASVDQITPAASPAITKVANLLKRKRSVSFVDQHPDTSALSIPVSTAGSMQQQQRPTIPIPPPARPVVVRSQLDSAAAKPPMPSLLGASGSGSGDSDPDEYDGGEGELGLDGGDIDNGEPRPFICGFDDCAARFSRNHDLKRHERIHTGEKKWKCLECERAFGRRDALARHTSAPGGRCKAVFGKRRLNRIRRISAVATPAARGVPDEVLIEVVARTAASESAPSPAVDIKAADSAVAAALANVASSASGTPLTSPSRTTTTTTTTTTASTTTPSAA